MENSLKGIIVAITIIALFITAILNFIVIFPQEQGVTFEGKSEDGYLKMYENNNTGIVSDLNSIENKTDDAFNQWDVTTGFMGTNQLKQGQSGVKATSKNIFTNIKIIATELFGQGSPILYGIAVISILSSIYIGYMIIKFVRTGS